MLLLTLSVAAFAQKGTKMELWSKGAPNDNGDEKDKAELTVYLPDAKKATGRAIVCLPGGGYTHLAMDHEGHQWATFFNNQGIALIVVKYRMPHGNREIPISDAEEAIRTVRRNAVDWHIDRKDVGIMGFSAGGHLAMMSATHNRTAYKPTFVCPIYPVVTMSDKRYTHHRSRRGALGVWGQFNKTMRDSLSLEKHIPVDCPPVFLVNCVDDPIVKYQNSELLDSALTANHIPHRYIQYQTGGHGFGGSDTKGTEECRQWKNECIQWISNLNQANE